MATRLNMMVRRVAFGAAVPMLAFSMFALTGCGTSESDTGSSSDAGKAAAQEEQVKSDYAVTIDACTVTTDYEGAPAIIIDYTFTNNSEDAQSFAVACNAKAFQNGVQLETAVVTDDLGNGYMAEIKPGATTPARIAYLLTDQSEVTVEVEEMFSLDDALLAEGTFAVA